MLSTRRGLAPFVYDVGYAKMVYGHFLRVGYASPMGPNVVLKRQRAGEQATEGEKHLNDGNQP